MKRIYPFLIVVGFLLPNYFVLLETVENGNILLYGDIPETFSQLFANRISTIFALDSLWTVLVFFIWSHFEAKATGVKNVWWVWVFTMAFGIASGFPLFLWLRARSGASLKD